MKYTKEFLVGIWVVGKLCGVYLLVLAVAMLGSMHGSAAAVLGAVMTAACCAVGGLTLFCMGHAAKQILHEGRH
ncbi:hypothetical protein [Gemmiger sp.]|uniref:hypothetical protein n=1 Tax=Gemmiger sp. TaxID=2049027 RepID=UPI003A927A25